MDFFAAQDAARARSRRLVWLFLASVAGLIAAIYAAVASLLVLGGHEGGWWDSRVFSAVAGVTILIVAISSLWKISALRAGGGSVARSVGGRPVAPTTQDPDERRFLNIVEEMAIASGLPVPEIYVLDAEDGINAFAAGFTPDDAAVAVTRGGITKLNRDELQGVVAHEFSHILNGDMRLNIHLIGLVFGLLVLSIVGQGILRFSLESGARRRGGKNDAAAVVLAIAAFGLILLIAGWIGVLFGRILQSAVSRQREFLADAAAVQFTRNPGGLAGALRKIGNAGSRVKNEHSQDVAHLFFASGLRLGWAGLFATHPPLEERIRALDSSWEGSFEAQPPPLPPSAAEFTAGASAIAAAAPQLARAEAIHGELEAIFGSDLRDPGAARDIVLALFPPTPDTAETIGVAEARQKLHAIKGADRTALAGMLMPALGRLPADERRELLGALDRLSDSSLDAFTFGTWWIVRRHLQRTEHPTQTPGKLDPDPAPFAKDASILIASLIHIGSGSEDIPRLFEEAMTASPSFQPLCSYPESQPDVAQLDCALRNLGGASFALRKEVIDAATRGVIGDGVVTESEAALMQVASLALDCPAPLPAGVA